MNRICYKGWPNCWRLSNGEVELVVTGDIGPRIISYRFAGGQNHFHNYEDEMGTCGEPHFVNRGGSRIWIAPEDRLATYAPDNDSVHIHATEDGLIATAPIEPLTQLEKQMVIRLAPSGTGVEVVHRVRNAGLLPVEFSIWILAVLAPGGTGISGFPPRSTHPEQLLPTHPLAMWAFTDLTDPRWKLLRKYVVLHQQPGSPQKLGHFNRDTWGAYVRNGEMFVKRSTADATRTYPDFGCSFELFTNEDVLELETIGPLQLVAPDEWIEHTEHWSLHRHIHINEWSDDELDRVVAPLVG